MMKNYFILVAILLLAGCSTTVKGEDEVNFRVNSYTVDCYGEMEGKCLLIQEGDLIGSDDWELFYYEDSIIGFVHEPGYVYNIVVLKTKIENPPQDASSYKYELLRIISKEKQE